MNRAVDNLGVRAKPLIVTRLTNYQAQHHQASTLSSSPSLPPAPLHRLGIGIASARHLSHAAASPPPRSSSTQPPPSPPPPSSPSSSTTRPPTSQTGTASQRPPPHASTASTSAHQTTTTTTSSSSSSRRGGRASQTSSWLWRTIYLTAGAATAATAAQYAYDPTPIHTTFNSLYNNLDDRIRYFTEPSRDKLLPDAVSPYPNTLPPRTLVIDLENTLVHSTFSRATGWRVAKRPGAEAFIAYMATFYEVVVFTSNLDTYADPILTRLDPNGCVSFRLYRAETHYKEGVHVKDLSRLNRDLRRVVVIDHDERSVSMQRENALLIPEWRGDPSDTALLDVIPVLEGVVREDVEDVREVLAGMQGKEVAVGVAEYRAMAKEREGMARGASVFGHVAGRGGEGVGEVSSGGGVEDGGDGDGRSGGQSLWRAMPGRARMFQTQAKSKSSGGGGGDGEGE